MPLEYTFIALACTGYAKIQYVAMGSPSLSAV
jgi:hypothetical protein